MLNWLRSLVAGDGGGGATVRAPLPSSAAAYTRPSPSAFVDLDRRRSSPRTEPPPAPLIVDLPDVLASRFEAALEELRGSGGDDGDELLASLAAGSGDSPIRQLPSAARQVMAVMQGSEPSVTGLCDVVERDPALSQALLKHANSAWYTRRFGSPASSVKLAIQRVGLRGVEATVMARTLEGALSSPGHGLAIMERMVWDHMVRVAHLAREMSVGAAMDPDRLYTLGLVHDVGKLIVFNRISDCRRALRRDLDVHPVWVGEVLRAVHEPLGGLALLSWGLDARDARVVALHHQDPPPAHLPEAALLATAERMDLARHADEVRTAS